MKLENQELIEEFYEKNKDKYGHLTLQQVKDCCVTPFAFTKKEIESGRLPVIRLKHFGTFLVYEKRAVKMLETLKIAFSNLKIEPEKYFKVKSMIENFLDNENKKKIK